MRMLPAWTAGFLGIALIATTNAPGRAGAVMTADDRQYLTFQIFTAGPGMTTEDGRHVLSRLPGPTLFDDEAKRILDAVGERGDALHRLGIVVGPLALDYTDAQLRTLIERTFEVASKYKIAVGLHIDDSKFWMNRSDLWRNPANVEWLDWNGTPNSGQYLNWFLIGLATTLALTCAAWCFAMTMGIVLTLIRMIPFRPFEWFVALYVEYHRNVPLLVQIFVWYFGVPSLLPRPIRQWIKIGRASCRERVSPYV